MRRLRTFSMALTLVGLLTGSLNAQVLSGTGGTVTTTGSSSTGVALSAVSGYPDVSVTTGNAASNSGFHVFNASAIELLRVQSNGNVGIGTNAPATLLHVNGGGVQGRFQGLNGSTYVGDGQLSSDRLDALYVQFSPARYIDFQNGKLVINSSGNVGIGATAPSGYLQIGALYPARFSDMPQGTNGTLLDMTASSEIHIANIQIGKAATPVIQTMGPAGQSALYLNEYSDNDVIVGSSSYTARGLKVQSTGLSSYAGGLSVGQNLTVTGTVSAGTIYANYQDVAEWVPAGGSLLAGTVVVISGDTNNTVIPSTQAYDTRVAGVVSPAPGLLLGIPSASKAKVATTGRVKVRVDASHQPIQVGDLLVTSDRVGMAMKSEPIDVGGMKIHRPGTLIGKALEPLPSDEGEILVLLSLQ